MSKNKETVIEVKNVKSDDAATKEKKVKAILWRDFTDCKENSQAHVISFACFNLLQAKDASCDRVQILSEIQRICKENAAADVLFSSFHVGDKKFERFDVFARRVRQHIVEHMIGKKNALKLVDGAYVLTDSARKAIETMNKLVPNAEASALKLGTVNATANKPKRSRKKKAK